MKILKNPVFDWATCKLESAAEVIDYRGPVRQMAGLNRITRKNLAQHIARVPGQDDEVYSPLYDSANYVAAGQLTLNFFQNPIGQGVTTAPGAVGGKTEADTNMSNAGLLPAFTKFYCTGLEVQIYPGVSPGGSPIASAQAGRFWNDVYAIGKSGWMRFRVGQRDYVLDGPLMNFPSTAGLGGVAAVNANLVAAADTVNQIEYARFVGQAYTIVPIYIESTQNFLVQMNWPAVVATPSTTIARLFVRLRGRLIRVAQ